MSEFPIRVIHVIRGKESLQRIVRILWIGENQFWLTSGLITLLIPTITESERHRT